MSDSYFESASTSVCVHVTQERLHTKRPGSTCSAVSVSLDAMDTALIIQWRSCKTATGSHKDGFLGMVGGVL